MARERVARPLDAAMLDEMASEIGDTAFDRVLGEQRWRDEHDRLAGRASMLAARALIEFLGGRHRAPAPDDSDIQPSDYGVTWALSEGDRSDCVTRSTASTASWSTCRSHVPENRGRRLTTGETPLSC